MDKYTSHEEIVRERKEKEEARKKKEDAEEIAMDNEYLEDEPYENNAFHFRGAFVSELQMYAKSKKHVRIGSFTHRSVVCRILSADAQKVIVQKSIDGKRLMITQASIKSIEEV